MSTETRSRRPDRAPRRVGLFPWMVTAFCCAAWTSARAATDWDFAPSLFLGAYRDGNVAVVGTALEDNVLRAAARFELSARRSATEFRFAYEPYYETYDENSDLDSLSHRLTASLLRETSRRSSFQIDLSGWIVERQPVRTDLPEVPISLVARTKQQTLYLALRGRLGIGRRSFFDWGVGGSLTEFGGERQNDLEDSLDTRVLVGWGLELDEKRDMGVRVRVGRIDFETAQTADAQELSVFFEWEVSRELNFTIDLGAVRTEEGDRVSTDPRLVAEATWTLTGGSTLRSGFRQGVTGGFGVATATLDRGVFVSFRPSERSPRYETEVTAYYWQREPTNPIDSTFELETLEALGTFAWFPGEGRFALGAFYSYHDQNGTAATGALAATSYSSAGVFVRLGRRPERGA